MGIQAEHPDRDALADTQCAAKGFDQCSDLIVGHLLNKVFPHRTSSDW
jgi:hypothetical protein